MDWSQTIDIFVLKYGISKQQYGVATAAGMFTQPPKRSGTGPWI